MTSSKSKSRTAKPRRKQKFVGQAVRVPYVTCSDCGKRAYASRRDARAEVRRQSGQGMSAYRCRFQTVPRAFAWHVGHTAGVEHVVYLRNSEEWA